jgi:hypothetical protein
MGELTMDQITMGQQAKKEDQWLRRATNEAIAAARKLVGETIPMNTPIGRLSDAQWGWVVAAVVFAWCRVKVEQSIEEGLEAERSIMETGASPSPCDAAVVNSILPALADGVAVDWSLPLAAWSKETMANFLLMAWQLMKKANAARGQGMGGLLGKSDWDKQGDNISDIPFP